MRISLRNEHRMAWVFLGVLLFAFMMYMVLGSWGSDPEYSATGDDTIEAQLSLENDVVFVRLNAGKVPVAASTYVYASNGSLDEWQGKEPIGQLLRKGRQNNFTLPGDIDEWENVTISVVDIIKDSLLYEITFEK